MVVDACKNMVEFETRKKGRLDGLVVKVYYEPYLSCSVGAAATEPIDVWARAGIGTRLRWKTLGVGGTDTQAENPSHCLH